MTELCIDTSGATAVTVVDDGKILGSSRNESGRHHAESITPCVIEALEEAGGDPGLRRLLFGCDRPRCFGSLVSGHSCVCIDRCSP